jgi:hypothetical protein
MRRQLPHGTVPYIFPPTIFRQTKTGQYSAPQTVLGFYALVLVIVEAGLLGVLVILSSNDSLNFLVPWVLAFAGLILIALLGVVVTMNVRDPTKLQLGEVKGKDFLEHQQITRGDSIAGEYVEAVPSSARVDPLPAIPADTAKDPEGAEGASDE